MKASPVLLLPSLDRWFFHHHWSYLDVLALAVVLTGYVVATWLLLRLRQVCRVVDQDFAASSRLSGSK